MKRRIYPAAPLASASAIAACLLSAAPAHASATFGIADDWLWDSNSQGFAFSSAFQTLRTGLGITQARVIVPFDAIAYAVPSGSSYTCVNDENSVQIHGQDWSTFLSYWLAGANADGLEPDIALTGSGAGHTLSGTDGKHNYVCGVEGLMQTFTQVHDWETYNEPEYSGLSAATAADLYGDFHLAAMAESRTSDNVAVGTFAQAPSSYITNYINELTGTDNQWPTIWAFHPYDDISDSGLNGCSYVGAPGCGDYETESLISQLDNVYSSNGHGSGPTMWLTEAGVWLNNNHVTDWNGQPIGTDIDGNPTAQADAAEGVRYLATLPQVSRVYYYEFQTTGWPGNGDSFDSAMMASDEAENDITPPTGSYEDGAGELRPSYCVLAYNYSPATAAADASCNDTTHGSPWDSDWQDRNG